MSIPVMPAEPAGLQIARQQLDELDALLERMLALPVYQAEDSSVDAERAVFSEDASRENDGASSRSGNSGEPPSDDCVPVQVPAADTSAAAEIPHTDVAGISSAVVPTEPSRLDGSEANPRGAAAEGNEKDTTTSAGGEPADEPWARQTLFLWPLVLPNRVFDLCVAPLGAPGRWLQSGRGRTFIGGAGLLFFAAALSWAILDWLLWNW